MIIGHIPFSTTVNKYIYSFHMPLFFFISGWLYHHKDMRKDVFKRLFKKMITPYFIFCFFGYILWILEMRPKDINIAIAPFRSILLFNTEKMPIVGAVWFLTAMLFVYYIYIILDNLCIKLKSKILMHIVTLILFLFGLVENTIFKVHIPFAFGPACVGLGFYHIGNIFKLMYGKNKFCYKIFNIEKIKLIILFVLTVFLTINIKPINMRKGEYPYWVFSCVVAVLMIVIYWNISVKLSKVHDNLAINFIECVGKNSIIYLGMNEIVINVAKSVLGKIGIYNHLVVFGVVIIVLYIISKLIIKSKYKKIFGI